MDHNLAILIPAAGASSRMRGADKLMLPAPDAPLLRLVCQRAVSVAADVIVTLPSLKHPRAELIADLPLHPIGVPDWPAGMSASIRRGIAALPARCDGVMILPADMPDLETADLETMIAAFRECKSPTVLRATAEDGRPGHPVIFPRLFFSQLAHVTGDEGAKSILRKNPTCLQFVSLCGKRALIDLDTPNAWAAWKAQMGR